MLKKLENAYCSTCRLFTIVVASFFVGGFIFVTYFHPGPIDLRSLISYDQELYIGIDISEVIKYDCNLKCSKFRTSYVDDIKSNKDPIEILKQNGFNTIKLRLFHTPSQTNSFANLSNIIIIAKRAKAFNMKFHLIIHYSDSYTFMKPKQWKDITQQADLQKEIYKYTLNILSQLNDNQIVPDIIQIGNQIDNKFLLNAKYPYLNQCNVSIHEDCAQKYEAWNNFALLLKSAIKAIRTVSNDVHILFQASNMNDNQLKYIFIDQFIKRYDIDFDIIGFSLFECNSVMEIEDIIQNKLNILSNINTDDHRKIRLIITEFSNKNYKCYQSLVDIVNTQKFNNFIGIEWIDGITYDGKSLNQNDNYKHISLFDRNGVMKADFIKAKNNKKPKRILNWNYVIISIIFVCGIAYNYCFWSSAKEKQQRKYQAIIKKG